MSIERVKVTFKLWIAIGCLLSFWSAPVSAQEGKPKQAEVRVPVHSQDVLIEAVDKNGLLGVYALDVLREGSVPELVVAGATMPRWSPNHRRILYIKNQQVWVHDLDGRDTLWYGDRAIFRFSTPADLARGKIWWDASGKANFIDYWPAFGNRLNRSVGMRESGDVGRPGYKGFVDTIIPKGESFGGAPGIYCIGGAAIDASDQWMAAQIYPFFPMGLGAAQSKIYFYKFNYRIAGAPSRQNPPGSAVPNDVELIGDQFVDEGAATHIITFGKLIGLPNSHEVDINPLLSSSSKYLAFTRIDTEKGVVRPVIVSLNAIDKVNEIDIDAHINEQADYPGQVWGWPNHFAFQWADGQDSLWIISAHGDRVYMASETNGKWTTVKVAGGLSFDFGRMSTYACHGTSMVCMYAYSKEKLYLLSATGGKWGYRTIFLPDGMNVREINW